MKITGLQLRETRLNEVLVVIRATAQRQYRAELAQKLAVIAECER